MNYLIYLLLTGALLACGTSKCDDKLDCGEQAVRYYSAYRKQMGPSELKLANFLERFAPNFSSLLNGLFWSMKHEFDRYDRELNGLEVDVKACKRLVEYINDLEDQVECVCEFGLGERSVYLGELLDQDQAAQTVAMAQHVCLRKLERL